MEDELDSTGSRHGALLSVAKNEAGERVDIGDLSELKRRGVPRPQCLCLACDRPLVARLGEKKQHHFGHKPAPEAERCWATSPEGELHLSAKRRVELVLQRACAEAATVTARIRCTKCRKVGEPLDVVHLSPTNRVLIESWGDPSRAIKPDVQVVDANGAPVLFVEVRVTHANEDAKVRFVRATGVPLLEVEGQQVLDELRSPEFDCVQHLNLPPVPPCAPCAKREEERRAEELHRAAERAAFEEQQLRREQVRSEAERRVRERWHREARSQVVSWCHVHIFRGSDLVQTALLEVEVVWIAEATRLRLRHHGRDGALKEWAGSVQELRRIYATDVRAEAKAVVDQLMVSIGAGATFDTFSGFRTKGFQDRPPTYERIQDAATNEWLTMYPWRDLARHFGHSELSALVRLNRWRTAKCIRGRTHVEARGVDDYFRKQRSSPPLRRPAPEKDWRWSGEVEAEINRMLGIGDSTLGDSPWGKVSIDQDDDVPDDAERERARRRWNAFLSAPTNPGVGIS